MSAFDDLMKKYVNEDYDVLVRLAKDSVNTLIPLCKEIDKENNGYLVLVAIINAALGADSTLSVKEQQFLEDVFDFDEKTMDNLVKIYTGKEEDLCDAFADSLSDENKFHVVNLVACIAACDETINRDEGAFIAKLIQE